jgi:hypothetical protein
MTRRGEEKSLGRDDKGEKKGALGSAKNYEL